MKSIFTIMAIAFVLFVGIPVVFGLFVVFLEMWDRMIRSIF